MTAMPTLPDPLPLAVARPFVKWAGGKTQLLPEVCKHLPARFGRYFEPFVGGGTLFFHLHAAGMLRHGVTLCDNNAELVAAYVAIRTDVEALIHALHRYERIYKRSSERARERMYYEVRAKKIALRNGRAVAARMLFLNKTCYNGLYRVNQGRGEFNTPHGDYKNPTICDEENLRACARALAGVNVQLGDFEKASESALAGDCWYADPPYVPTSATSNFTAYTRHPFGPAEQERLRDLALRLKSNGVRVLLSNSDVPFVRKLYSNGFSVKRVKAKRTINSVVEGRGHVDELLIW